MGKFIVSDYVADLDSAATRELLLRPSYASGKDVKLSLSVCATVSVLVALYEDTGKQNNAGNAKTAFAADRLSSEASALTVCHTPDAGGDGTLIWSGISASGIPVNFPPMSEKAKLQRGTSYLLRITALADNNALNTSVLTEEDPFGDTPTSLSSSSSSSSCRSSSSSSSSCQSSSSSSSCRSSSSSSSSSSSAAP